MKPYNPLIMVLNVPLQSDYLYHDNWSASVDGVLIDTVLRLKCEIRWNQHEFPTYFMGCASRDIHDRCGLALTEYAIATRLSLLARRLRTFKEIITSKGTYWDKVDNFVYVANSVWVTMMENNPFAAAYYYHGEPKYYRLRNMFGRGDMMEHSATDVSSSMEVEYTSSSMDIDYMAADVEEDKVNSPVEPPKRSVRRKLFDDDEVQHIDDASTNEPTICIADVVHGGKIRSRFERQPPKPYNHVETNALEGLTNLFPFASSCASNSPHGLATNTPK